MSTVADPADAAPQASLSEDEEPAAAHRSLSEERSDETKGAPAPEPVPASVREPAPAPVPEPVEGTHGGGALASTGSATGSRIRLIATDLDGTLLDPSGRVTTRTRAALDAARAAGIVVVPVTARQPIGLRAIAAEAGFDGWALCGNGAYGIHLGTREQLFASEIAVPAQQRIAQKLGERIPDLLFASVREAGEVFVAQEGYAEVATLSDHKRDPRTMGAVPLAEVLGAPSLKLVIRHRSLTPAEIFAVLGTLDPAGFAATLSGAPFVEVMAEGVTKATGLARLCAALGIDHTEVLAFGDALNDVEMLRWAGRGIAMANAEPEAIAAADEVTASNADDGVAAALERILVR
jgi:Cof subfamily protein (haloacid dehalogenase superfamily)